MSLWAVKETKSISIAFPLMVTVRYVQTARCSANTVRRAAGCDDWSAQILGFHIHPIRIEGLGRLDAGESQEAQRR